MTRLLAALAATLPTAALACGGLFCDTAQPVNQAAERILFAQDGDTVHMHVRLTWSGPPQDFGWLLPTPPDVETTLSSESLFGLLDQAYGPRFSLITEFFNCEDDDQAFPGAFAGADAGAGAGGAGGGDGGGVNVLSREQVGPYDRAILQADDVAALLEWLATNEYQVPDGAEATLQPYVEMGAAFVAIKLVPGAGSNDVTPLALRFTANSPAIPVRPTANAADPDMGIIVHVLGRARAVPTNFRHVLINEAALDWQNGGQNYADVVSQAADEAQGQAFATDYAGPVQNGLPLVIAEGTIEDVEIGGWDTLRDSLDFSDLDIQRVVRATVFPNEGNTVEDLIACPWCYDGEVAEVDGAELARRLREEINPPREALVALFEGNDYMTRLYTTMSAAEMTADPIFDTNPDMEEVAASRQARLLIPCLGGEVRRDLAVIETPSGLRIPAEDQADLIQRQGGETVRGEGVPGAAVIEQTLVAGQPEIIEDRRAALADRYAAGLPEDDEGCGGCAQSPGEGGALLLVLLGGALVLRRRRGREM